MIRIFKALREPENLAIKNLNLPIYLVRNNRLAYPTPQTWKLVFLSSLILILRNLM
jgi:hypothetical protein